MRNMEIKQKKEESDTQRTYEKDRIDLQRENKRDELNRNIDEFDKLTCRKEILKELLKSENIKKCLQKNINSLTN